MKLPLLSIFSLALFAGQCQSKPQGNPLSNYFGLYDNNGCNQRTIDDAESAVRSGSGSVCAIVYDDKDCGKNTPKLKTIGRFDNPRYDWRSLHLKSSRRKVSLPSFLEATHSLTEKVSCCSNKEEAEKAVANARYKDDIESLVVRKGCKLQAFKKSDCTGRKATFDATNRRNDLIIKKLKGTAYDDFDEAIECMICRC